jgi:hypothetical protein
MVSGLTHDTVLSDHDARNARGFMYSRDRRTRHRRFVVQEAPGAPARGMTMGEMTQAEQSPVYELLHYVDFFGRGIGGQKWINMGDRGKLKISKKILTYPKGTLLPSRELRNTTLSSAADEKVPSGFAVTPRDTSSGATGGYEETELWAFVGRDIYSGGDDDWTLETEPQAIAVYYRNGAAFGKWVVAPAWWGGTDMPDVAMPYAYKEPTTANWIASTVADGRFKHLKVAKNNAGVDLLWGGNHVFDIGKTLNGAHNNSTTTLTASADISGDLVVNDIIICGVGDDAEQEPMLVTAVSGTSITVIRAYGSAAITYEGGEKIHLYQPHAIKSSSDPTNAGSWSSSTLIGEKEHPITGLDVHADTDTLLIAKTDGLWQQYYEPIARRLFVRNLTIDYRGQGHPTNFTGIHTFQGHTLLPLGGGGLLDMDVATGVITDISFSLTAPDQTKLHGQVMVLESGPDCVFMSLKDKSAELIHLLAGHLVTVDGGALSWAWEMIGEVGAGATITDHQSALFHDATRDDHDRLWIGFTEASVSEVPHFLPVSDRDKTDGYNNDGDGYVDFLDIDFNLPRVNKAIKEIDVESKNLLQSAGRQWTFKYLVDDPGGTFITADAVNVSPYQKVELPEGLNGKTLELEAVPNMTTVGTTAPEILSIRVKAYLQPDPQKVFPMSLYLADNQTLLNGVVDSTMQGDLDQLNIWNEQAGDLILHTPDGKVRDVVFLPGTMVVDEHFKQYGMRPEYTVTFLLAEVG